jgi:hypothetical protein
MLAEKSIGIQVRRRRCLANPGQSRRDTLRLQIPVERMDPQSCRISNVRYLPSAGALECDTKLVARCGQGVDRRNVRQLRIANVRRDE